VTKSVAMEFFLNKSVMMEMFTILMAVLQSARFRKVINVMEIRLINPIVYSSQSLF